MCSLISLPPRAALTATAVSLVLALGACERGAAASAASSGTNASIDASTSGGATASRGGVPTLPARADPCGWVPAESVSAILGPLAGQPRRGGHHDSPEPDPKGYACVYTLPSAGASPTGEPNTVAVELRTDDATAQESGFRAGDALAQGLVKQLNGGHPAAVDTMPRHRGGWDYTNYLPDEFLGRVGHLGVFVNTRVYPAINHDKVERLAALVRDHVPDEPFASERAQSADGADPCTLITPREAETVLGKLKYPPFRSLDETPLVTPGGAGCSYYVGQHRVLTIKPEWDMGKQLFAIAAGTSQRFGQVIPGQKEAADTLEGAWDQAAAGTDGTLYFLKGDKMLTVVYRTSNATLPDALKLVNVALERL